MNNYNYGPRPGIDRYEYGDGLFGFIGKIAKAIVKPVLNMIPKNTILSKALVSVGMATPKQALTTTAMGVGLGAAGSALIPSLPGAAVRTGAAAFGGPGTATSPTGAWGPRGPGNKMQWPWQDPSVQAGLKQFALDDSFLKVCYRAPRGYVVVRDENGRPYPLQKWVAKKVGWWTQPRQPPISAGDWHRYQTARSVEKKLVKLARHALAKHHKSGHASNVVHFKRKAA